MDFSVMREAKRRKCTQRKRKQAETFARVGYNTRHLFAIAYLKETDMSLLNVPAGKDLPEDLRCYRDPC
jgi:inorganic pyrophosphatase